MDKESGSEPSATTSTIDLWSKMLNEFHSGTSTAIANSESLSDLQAVLDDLLLTNSTWLEMSYDVPTEVGQKVRKKFRAQKMDLKLAMLKRARDIVMSDTDDFPPTLPHSRGSPDR